MMDDDTIPRQDALERLLACPATSRETTGFVYSLQVYPDGSVPRHDPGPTGADEWALTVLSERCVPVEKCSFVAIMVSRRALERVGYPIREMFFMVDDYEFTRRIVGAGLKGYCVLDSVVLHDTQIPVVYDVRSWSPVKKRYSVRNHVFYYRTAPESLRKRAWRISRLLAVEVIGLASGASNMSVVLWALKGLFFNPKPEMPAPVNRQGGDRQGLAV
jgi:GT2 family glycosyltransferase